MAQKQSQIARIRGPGLEVFRKGKEMTYDEAIRAADAEGRVIASNKRIDSALMVDERMEATSRAFPCLTGTLVAYPRAGKPFGKTMECEDCDTHHRWIIPVPEQFQKKKGALVTEHPDFSIQIEGNDILIIASRISLLENFPDNDGGYVQDPHFGIPVGSRVGPDNPDIRYLHGIWSAGHMILLVSRTRGPMVKHLFVTFPSTCSGVIVEAPMESEAVKAAPEQPAVPGFQSVVEKISHTSDAWELVGLVDELFQRVSSERPVPRYVVSVIRKIVDKLTDLIQKHGTDNPDIRQLNESVGRFVTLELPKMCFPHWGIDEIMDYVKEKLIPLLP